MKTIIKGAIAVLLILGAVKTFQEYDVQAEAMNYYNQAKDGELFQNIENVNFDALKNIQFDDMIPSDFF
ncbi:MAG TPA: hypothetical protein VK115_05940 [Staphylococcus sp.]|nr:hypothetical protein [Staphylococcus sp.]